VAARSLVTTTARGLVTTTARGLVTTTARGLVTATRPQPGRRRPEYSHPAT